MRPAVTAASVSHGNIRNRQMFFGGIPGSNEPPTLVKEVTGEPEIRKKKFSTEAFLDLYFKE
jgi:hypothetical protein